MRVHIVDPSAYTPPYDHALCRALAAAGGEVELYTSRFAHGPVAPPEGYGRRELFYPLAAHVALRERAPRGEARRARARHAALPARARERPTSCTSSGSRVQHLDGWLLPARAGAAAAPRRPLVLTAHDMPPAGGASGPARGAAAAV